MLCLFFKHSRPPSRFVLFLTDVDVFIVNFRARKIFLLALVVCAYLLFNILPTAQHPTHVFYSAVLLGRRYCSNITTILGPQIFIFIFHTF
jgi:hypothetical protein